MATRTEKLNSRAKKGVRRKAVKATRKSEVNKLITDALNGVSKTASSKKRKAQVRAVKKQIDTLIEVASPHTKKILAVGLAAALSAGLKIADTMIKKAAEKRKAKEAEAPKAKSKFIPQKGVGVMGQRKGHARQRIALKNARSKGGESLKANNRSSYSRTAHS